MSVKPNPSLAQQMTARHRELMAAAASEAADILHDNLSSATHGTGAHYPRLPNRSSAPGEMPVLQSGELAAGVTSRQGESGALAQVVIEDDLGKLLGLEFSPPSTNPHQPGTPQRTSGGRAPMWETMMDERTQEAMRERMRRT